MKRCFLILIYFCLISWPVLAEPNSTEAPLTSPTPPALMQAMMPAGAKTRFYGEVKFSTSVHKVYFLHFYEFPQNPPVVYAPNERHSDTDKDYIADLFVQEIRRQKVSYRLVNRLKLDRSYFRSEVYAFDKVAVNFLWLLPAKRQVPILRLNCTVTDGFYGPFGEDILFVFDKGLAHESVMQGFYNYCDNSGFVNYIFDRLDGRSIRTVTLHLLDQNGDAYMAFPWNGKGFFKSPLATPTPTPPK